MLRGFLNSRVLRGVKFGRPRKMTPHQRQEALQRLAAGETMADHHDWQTGGLEPPNSAIRALIFGSIRPTLISLLSLSMISAGVFLGAPNASTAGRIPMEPLRIPSNDPSSHRLVVPVSEL